MKVIFLDIDGVLNYEKCPYKLHGVYFVDPEKIKLLKKIVDNTGARIVLSSTWRCGRFLQDENPREYKLFCKLRRKLEEYGIRFYSYTPIFDYDKRRYRGDEIKQWFVNWHANTIDNFVILDDDSDMEPYMDRLVQTTWTTGLTESDVEKAIVLLNT